MASLHSPSSRLPFVDNLRWLVIVLVVANTKREFIKALC
jgi:hypothetical protein